MNDQIRAKIFDVASLRLGVDFPTLPIIYDNQRAEVPKSGIWIMFTLFPSANKLQALGMRRYDAHGSMTFDLLVPEESGTKTMYEVEHALMDVLFNKRFSVSDGTITVCDVKTRRTIMQGGYVDYIISFDYKAQFQLSS